MANLAKLVVNLEAQTAKYQRELDKANRKLNKFQKNQSKALAKIASGFKLVGAAVAGFIGLRALTAFKGLVQGAAEAADALAKQSDVLGITTEKLAAYQHAARLSGSDNSGLEKGFKKLQKSIVDANNGLSTYTRAFEKLDVDPATLQRMTPDKQFESLANAFAGLTTQAERVAIAYDLFGGRNTALLNTLVLVGDEIEQLESDTKQWGVAITRVEAATIENSIDEFERAKTAVQGIATSIALEMAPAVGELARQFADAAAQSEGFFEAIGVIVGGGTGSLESAIADYEQQINLLVDLRDALAPGATQERAAFDAQILPLTTILELSKNRLNLGKKTAEQVAAQAELEKKVSAELALQADLIEEIVTTRKEHNKLAEAGFFTEGGFTLQDPIDEILRPDIAKDIEDTKRTTEAFFKSAIENAEAARAATEDFNDAARDLGFTFASAFEDAILEGEKLSDVLKGLLKDILRIALRKTVTEPLGNFFGGLFGGGKAAGGPVKAGTTYLVGEKGPEYFTPRQSGNIIPNGMGGGVNFAYTIDARGIDEASVLTRMIPLLEQTRQLSVEDVRRQTKQGRFT